MKHIDLKPHQYALVYLYDPIPLDKVSLDILKTQFAGAVYSPDDQVILAGSTDQKLRVQIQTARLELTEEGPESFSEKNFDPIEGLFRALPPLAVKAYGINLHLRGTVKDAENSGIVPLLMLFEDVANPQSKFGNRIIGTAHRILYGDPKEYYDLRITPLEVAASSILHVQLHKHKDVEIAEEKRILVETAEAQKQTINEWARLDRIL